MRSMSNVHARPPERVGDCLTAVKKSIDLKNKFTSRFHTQNNLKNSNTRPSQRQTPGGRHSN